MKIHHIGYLVKNLSEAEKQFLILGYQRETECVYDSLRDADICFCVNGEYRIELVEPKSEESVVYGLLKKYKNTPYHICYISNDFDEDMERLRTNGFWQMGEPMKAIAIENKRVVFLVSNQSGMIELLEQ